MKALRYQDQKLSVEDVPRPDTDGEVLVRVKLSGICNTDLEIARGYAGFNGTLGHEFVGVIEEVSEARLIIAPSDTVNPATRVTARTERSLELSDVTARMPSFSNYRWSICCVCHGKFPTKRRFSPSRWRPRAA